MNPPGEPPPRARRKGWLARVRAAPAYVSMPIGVLFVIGGVFWFLPVLGLWMLPLGLAILAPRVPIAKRLQRRLMRRWIKYRIIRKRIAKE